jgi:hypothetical protein
VSGYVLATLPITFPLLVIWIVLEARRNVDFLSVAGRKLVVELREQFHDDEESTDLMDGVTGASVRTNTDGPTDVHVKTDCSKITSHSKAAMRLAFFAISKVGYLDNTKVNAKIYEKTILNEMEKRGFRYTDRVKILPQAIVCCFLKDEGTTTAFEVLHHMVVNPAVVP